MPTHPGSPIFVFPGQGTQRSGMGRAWQDHPSWDVVADASAVAQRDVAHLLLHAGPDELTETRNAQLATLTLSLVALDAVERMGIHPAACAGHSLGEYSALIAAGALSFDDGVAIVAERGDAMQFAADICPGTMKAIVGLDDDSADVACYRADGQVWVANYNAPSNVVIAGDRPSVDSAVDQAFALGARKVFPVPVGGAFHTPFMAPARDRLRKVLSAVDFWTPEVPVVANVDARAHRSAEEWQRLLSAQLCSPVRWRRSVLRLDDLAAERGHRDRSRRGALFIELGCGGLLTSLTKRIVPDSTAIAVATPDDLGRLSDALAGQPTRLVAESDQHGEYLDVPERMVISPCAGVFEPIAAPVLAGADGSPVEVGTVVGRVNGREVCSAFAGRFMAMLALPGERVRPGQPVAWLRAG